MRNSATELLAEHERMNLRKLLQLGTLVLTFATGKGSPISSPSPIQCLQPEYCTDGVTPPFLCVKKQKQCCVDEDGSLNLVDSPRGTYCCHGTGKVYLKSTHACLNKTIVQLKKDHESCGMDDVYNTLTEACCISNEGKSKRHSKMIEGQRQCCGMDYIDTSVQSCCDGVSYDPRENCCAGGIVMNHTSRRFGGCSVERQQGCHTEVDCCSGKRILDMDSHMCYRGEIFPKTLPDHNDICHFRVAGERQFKSYNNDKQECDSELGPITLPAGQGICSGEYYWKDADLCCSGEVFRNKSKKSGWECCRSSPNAYKGDPSICPGRSFTVAPRNGCPQTNERKCSQQAIERRFKKNMKRGAYVLALKVSKLRDSNETHIFYKVKTAKQIIGSHGKKTMVIPTRLKVLGVPKCGCCGALSAGNTYLLITKEKLKNGKRISVHGTGYDIIPAESSTVVKRLFDL